MELQDINLTEEDFNIIIEGLDALPEKGRSGLMMSQMVATLLTKDDPRLEKEADAKIQKEFERMDRKNKERADDITLLKSKLILLKRFLQTNGALKTAEKIINKK